MCAGFWFVGNRSALVAKLNAGLDPQIRFYSRDASYVLTRYSQLMPGETVRFAARFEQGVPKDDVTKKKGLHDEGRLVQLKAWIK